MDTSSSSTSAVIGVGLACLNEEYFTDDQLSSTREFQQDIDIHQDQDHFLSQFGPAVVKGAKSKYGMTAIKLQHCIQQTSICFEFIAMKALVHMPMHKSTYM
jgi:hypothetical protein